MCDSGEFLSKLSEYSCGWEKRAASHSKIIGLAKLEGGKHKRPIKRTPSLSTRQDTIRHVLMARYTGCFRGQYRFSRV